MFGQEDLNAKFWLSNMYSNVSSQTKWWFHKIWTFLGKGNIICDVAYRHYFNVLHVVRTKNGIFTKHKITVNAHVVHTMMYSKS